ncbi:hypothetical protein [Sulfurimonas xiamenensis]|uniref:Uncharacterized protein n=1 Tax=Sulfurimonas xiamenensis TaxID=2590021 RepID=A0AAJ4A221_9BACT|nr:hypothetical protein [Sulfurimonas xiamenensis]QFR42408.1 hypothetical protein FJR47_00110 [Sulfurimonas xiamenensis]
MKIIGQIDSISLRSENFEQMFTSDNYIIVTVKGVGIFEPKLWRDAFKQRLTKSIIEAKILHTSTGLTIALKRYNRSLTKQTLDIAGLRGYDDKAMDLNNFLQSHFLEFMECEIKRIDICFDFLKVPNRVIKRLCDKREPFKFCNTTYYKTPKELKTNDTLDIKRYDKQKEAKLPRPMERLEFCFKGGYFPKGMKLNNLDRNFLSKMEKTIKRFSGIDAKIFPLSYIV